MHYTSLFAYLIFAFASAYQAAAQETQASTKQVSVEIRVLEAPLALLDSELAEMGRKDTSNVLPTTETELELLRRLQLKEGVEFKHAARFVVLEREAAILRAVEEVVFPTAYEQHPEPNTTGRPPLPQFAVLGPETEKPGYREVGLVVEVMPEVRENDDVLLTFELEYTKQLGDKTHSPGVSTPVIHSFKTSTSTLVPKKHSLLLSSPAPKEKRELLFFIRPLTLSQK